MAMQTRMQIGSTIAKIARDCWAIVAPNSHRSPWKPAVSRRRLNLNVYDNKRQNLKICEHLHYAENYC